MKKLHRSPMFHSELKELSQVKSSQIKSSQIKSVTLGHDPVGGLDSQLEHLSYSQNHQTAVRGTYSSVGMAVSAYAKN
jgi:hypothetical protein